MSSESVACPGRSGRQVRTGHSPVREIVQLRVSQQELDGPKILGPFVDQCHLGATHRMGAIDRWIEPDSGNPMMNDPSVLSR